MSAHTFWVQAQSAALPVFKTSRADISDLQKTTLDQRFGSYRVFEMDIDSLIDYLKTEPQKPHPFELSIDDWTLSLNLTEKMRTPSNSTITVFDESGHHEIVVNPRSGTYKGEVFQSTNSRATLTLSPNFMMGLVVSNGKMTSITPLADLDGMRTNQFVVWESLTSLGTVPPVQMSSTVNLNVACEVDYELANNSYFADNPGDIYSYVVACLSEVEIIYNHAFSPFFVQEQHIYVNGAPDNYGSDGTMPDKVNHNWNIEKLKRCQPRDVVHLFSGKHLGFNGVSNGGATVCATPLVIGPTTFYPTGVSRHWQPFIRHVLLRESMSYDKIEVPESSTNANDFIIKSKVMHSESV